MIGEIADTHAVIWRVFGDRRLSATARAVFDRAGAEGNQIGLSSIAFSEIVYLVEKRPVPPDTFARLAAVLDDPAGELREIPFTRAIAAALPTFG